MAWVLSPHTHMVVDLEHILLIDEPLLVTAVGHSQCDGCQLRLSTFATDFVALECKAKYDGLDAVINICQPPAILKICSEPF